MRREAVVSTEPLVDDLVADDPRYEVLAWGSVSLAVVAWGMGLEPRPRAAHHPLTAVLRSCP